MTDARTESQRRADQVRAFRAELTELEQSLGALVAPESRTAIEQYHAALLNRLKSEYDIDISAAEEQLSLGMRITSLLGTVTLCAALFFFFYRFWGRLVTPAQLALVGVAPVLGLVVTELIARRERARYFTGLAAAVTFSALVLSLSVIGIIYNLPPSPVAFLVWGAFALVLATTYDLVVLYLAGTALLTIGGCGSVVALAGADWTEFLTRPELLLAAGLLWVALPAIRPHRHPEFTAVDHGLGAVLALFSVSILGVAGKASWLPLPETLVERLYDGAGLALAAGGIWVGIRRGWGTLRITSTVMLIVMVFLKAFDWWWEWMPRYLFFLVLGGLAVGVLVLLRRTRSRRTA
jgi:uncharacterized membrane protein